MRVWLNALFILSSAGILKRNMWGLVGFVITWIIALIVAFIAMVYDNDFKWVPWLLLMGSIFGGIGKQMMKK